MQATPGDFDCFAPALALSCAELVGPADVEDLLDVGQLFGLKSLVHPAGLRHGRDHARGVVL